MTQIIRLATSAISNRAGFNLDQSDDMNTAVEEVFRFLCATCGMDEKSIILNYSIHDDKLELRADDSTASLAGNESKMGSYCRFILDKMTDSFEESSRDGKFSILVTKYYRP
jgi:anti-sigma regulatory factor (Ser/Thr protein kinase)